RSHNLLATDNIYLRISTKKTDYIWYRTNPSVVTAFLYNCRELDLVDGPGIPAGAIVKGTHGYVVVEKMIPEVTANLVPFKPNAKCQWQEYQLSCMALPGGKPRLGFACCQTTGRGFGAARLGTRHRHLPGQLGTRPPQKPNRSASRHNHPILIVASSPTYVQHFHSAD
ncbi:MAG: hypothetical protein WCO56_27260, partial [Verrucomicrobiota bacterium]